MQILLILTMVMPQNLPDKRHKMYLDDINDVSTTRDFRMRKCYEENEGLRVIALKAICVTTKPEDDQSL